MRRPSCSSTGRARATASLEPPQKRVSVPFAAPSTPPDTGASTKSTDRPAHAWAIAAAVAGCTVDVSTTTVPGRADASTPSAPSTTSRTAASSLTASTTTSARAAASAGVAATAAPSSASALDLAGDRFHTTTSPPAATSRVAIRPPMLPRPRTAHGGGTGPVAAVLSLIDRVPRSWPGRRPRAREARAGPSRRRHRPGRRRRSPRARWRRRRRSAGRRPSGR